MPHAGEQASTPKRRAAEDFPGLLLGSGVRRALSTDGKWALQQMLCGVHGWRMDGAVTLACGDTAGAQVQQ